MTRTLAHDLTGCRVRCRQGFYSWTTTIEEDRGKVLIDEHGEEVKRRFVRDVLEQPRATTGRIVRGYTRQQPSRDDEPTVREVAERVRPRGERRRARKDRGYLAHVREHRCVFEGVSPCSGVTDAHHLPEKKMGDAFGSDYETSPACRGHHMEVTRSRRVAPLSELETEVRILRKSNAILAGWVMRAEGDAA